MAQDETYNGWTNRETWAVALHINNDQGWQESVCEAIRQKLIDEGEDYSFGDVSELERWRWAGEAIQAEMDFWADVENLPAASMGGTDPDAVADWAKVRDDIGSLWRVNWTELGASFLEDLEDE